MKKLLVIATLLLLPQLALAKVYMCVDPVTSKTSFTDKACGTTAEGEEVRVDATNLDSGTRYRKRAERKTWLSEADDRKNGLEYNEERRALYHIDATVSTN